MKRVFLLTLALVIVAGSAVAQQLVKADQGKPGTQGPWPVTLVGSSVAPPSSVIVVSADGGQALVTISPAQCASTITDGGSAHKNTVVGASAVPVPTDQAAVRAYVEICNSLQNTGTPLLKCRVDGTAPVMAATNAGDVLGIGDCILYAIPASIAPQCISDAVGTNALSYECRVP